MAAGLFRSPWGTKSVPPMRWAISAGSRSQSAVKVGGGVVKGTRLMRRPRLFRRRGRRSLGGPFGVADEGFAWPVAVAGDLLGVEEGAERLGAGVDGDEVVAVGA